MLDVGRRISAAVAMVSNIFGNLTPAEIHDLLFTGEQSPLVKRRRGMLIASRVRMVAAVFALLTPLWIPVDLLVFETKLAMALAALRVCATIAFALIALSFRKIDEIRHAHLALGSLLSVPLAFFLASNPLLSAFPLAGTAPQIFAAGYTFLPFVMVAGLSVFPITAFEGIILAAPLWLANLGMAVLGYTPMSFASHLGALWLLGLLGVVATLAGMSQLHFMIQLVSQASHDGLTRGFTRRVGEEMLELQFSQAQRADLPLSLVFVDLDHFKMVNDRFGHEEGDRTLRNAAAALRRALRRGDIMVRWGGEEFLIVLPNTPLHGATTAIRRLHADGFGTRPDGSRQTASIGIAERAADGCASWPELVEKADHRMYAAKQAGRDRVVAGEEVVERELA